MEPGTDDLEGYVNMRADLSPVVYLLYADGYVCRMWLTQSKTPTPMTLLCRTLRTCTRPTGPRTKTRRANGLGSTLDVAHRLGTLCRHGLDSPPTHGSAPGRLDESLVQERCEARDIGADPPCWAPVVGRRGCGGEGYWVFFSGLGAFLYVSR